MEIYKYINNAPEWYKVVNTKCKEKERQQLMKEWIISNGTKLSLKEFFNENRRYDKYHNISYVCYGKPENPFEKLAYAEIETDGQLMYVSYRNSFPEDITPLRTDWDDMRNYADGMADFIDDLKDYLGEIL